MESYVFITSSEQPSNAARDEVRRRLVRSRAKRYSLETPESDVCQSIGPTSKGHRNHTGRFHLHVLPEQANEQLKTGSEPEKKSHNHRYNKQMRNIDLDDANYNLVLRTAERSPSCGILSSTSMALGRLDSFSMLPIKLASQEELLFRHVNATFELPSYIFNAGADLLKLVCTDPAWFHATLSLIALHRDLSSGRGISPLSLQHRGKALSIVKWRLNNSTDRVDDATIGAVASLINFDTVIGDHASSTAHARGLQVMVALRGGIQSLAGNEVLQKVVGWSDLTFSSTWKQTPEFRIIHTPDCDGTIQHILKAKERFPLVPFFRIQGGDDDLNDILDVLQILTALAESPSITKARERDLMKGIYIVEHFLLTVATKDAPNSWGSQFDIRVAIAAAFALYLYFGLHEMPRTALMLQHMVKRLRSILEEPESLVKADMLEQKLLLWMTALGTITAFDLGDKLFFQDIVEDMSIKLGLEDVGSQMDVLKLILWRQRFGDLENPRIEIML